MIDWYEAAQELGYLLYQVMAGDTCDDVYEALKKYGLVDDDYEWIYSEDE